MILKLKPTPQATSRTVELVVSWGSYGLFSVDGILRCPSEDASIEKRWEPGKPVVELFNLNILRLHDAHLLNFDGHDRAGSRWHKY